jgi:predicted permease
MRVLDAWRLSKPPYVEITYRSTVLTRGGFQQRGGLFRDPARQVRSTITNSRVSKIIFAIFISIGAVVPLLQNAFSPTAATLAASIAFSLAICLAYIVLYSLQVLPSFTSSEPFALLSTLPFSDRDYSLVTTFSFLRTFDYLLVGAVVTQVVGIALITNSAAAVLVMLVASLVNITFAVAIALWLSGLFYRNITRGGRSKSAALTRIVFLVTWGLAAMSTGFLFSLINNLLPAIDALYNSGLSHSAAGMALAFLHPFLAALVVTGTVYPAFVGQVTSGLVGGSALVVSAGLVYVALAFGAGRRTLRAVAGVAHGQTISVARQTAKEFLVRVRGPLLAYVQKDLRVASKTPSMAFIFALPIFEMLIVALNTSAFTFLRATSVFTATLLGCFFTVFSSSVLLNTEGVGLDYTMSLPLGPAVIINAKALVATATYVPVPLVIAALFTSRGTTAGILVLVPFIEIMAVAAAATAQLIFFIKGYAKRTRGPGGKQERGKSAFQASGFTLMSGGDLFRLAAAVAVAAAIIVGPMAAYALAWFATTSHPLAVVVMAVAAAAELLIVRIIVSRL